MLDVCIHVATRIGNSGISEIFNQEYVNIILAVIFILLYL